MADQAQQLTEVRKKITDAEQMVKDAVSDASLKRAALAYLTELQKKEVLLMQQQPPGMCLGCVACIGHLWGLIARAAAQFFSQAAVVGTAAWMHGDTAYDNQMGHYRQQHAVWSGSAGMCSATQRQWRRQGSRRGCVGIPQHMLGLVGWYL